MSPQSVRPRRGSANIFINYRREDSSGHAGRLFDALGGRFAGRLFMDIDTLQPGVDFVEAIEQAVDSCDVLIVIIGREWLTIHDAAGHRRLDNPADFVRLEIESALARKIRVIPVLVQDAPMPHAEELPATLLPLARRNAIELSDARWAYDVDRLARTIQDILEETEGSAAAPGTVAPPVATKPAAARLRLLSLGALGLVAALVLAAFLWKQPAPAGNQPPVSDQRARVGDQAPVPSRQVVSLPARPLDSAPAAWREVREPRVSPTVPAAGAREEPAINKVLPGKEAVHEQPASHRTPAAPVLPPKRKPALVEVSVDDAPSPPAEPSKSPAAEPRIPAAPPPPKATIASPASGERVGGTVQVRGTVVGLGEQRAFLCIRQANGAIYPRGELFPKSDGQWSIQLRSSKERTFDILVVTSTAKEASQVLSDQKSRDDGLPVLPAGASISGDAVAVKRQGKLLDILAPK